MTQLVWFRNDLRTLDNTALTRAAAPGPVRGIFIATPGQWQKHHMAPVRQRLLEHAVSALAGQLAKLGIVLDVVVLDDFAAISTFLADYCQQHQIHELHANREYLVDELHRDEQVTQALNIDCHFYDDRLLLPPGAVMTQQGEPYKVFTPFKNSVKQQLKAAPPQVLRRLPAQQEAIMAPSLPGFSDVSEDARIATWPDNEDAALTAMRRFVSEQASDYKAHRDFPALDNTSRLSAALSIGLLSPRQCLWRLAHQHGDAIWDDQSGPGTWLNELIWRDFYGHVAWHFPAVVKGRAFQRDTEQLTWADDDAAFNAWCQGRTGFPIVDAAMRQLRSTGWMHNRLRMITASFLVKDLHIDWRRGEAYFMSQLIDGDFAANNGGWQWAASTGTDAAPYFRIFNPWEQGKRFDPDGRFIRHWLPELSEVSEQYLHEPHRWPGALNYPAPLVDHKTARQQTLAMFKALKEAS